MSVPPQYFQSIIALELAVTGALLWQIRYFEHDPEPNVGSRALPHPLVRGLVALVLLGTILGSLLGILHEGEEAVAILVGIGFMGSILPILLRVLPPLTRGDEAEEHGQPVLVTIVGLLVYVLIAVVFVVVLGS
jgi:hypothetical protein